MKISYSLPNGSEVYNMSIKFYPDSFDGKNKDGVLTTFYVIRAGLFDNNGTLIKKGDVIMWLTKDLFDSYTSK